MNVPIVVTIDWTDDEIRRAYTAYVQTSLQWRRMRAVCWLLGPAVILLGLTFLNVVRRPLVVPMAATVGLGLALVLRPVRQKRALLKAIVGNFPDRHRLNTCTLSRDKYSVQNDVSLAELIWPAFEKILRTPEGFLLHRSELHFLWLPLDGFRNDDDVERFASFARTHIHEYHETR